MANAEPASRPTSSAEICRAHDDDDARQDQCDREDDGLTIEPLLAQADGEAAATVTLATGQVETSLIRSIHRSWQAGARPSSWGWKRVSSQAVNDVVRPPRVACARVVEPDPERWRNSSTEAIERACVAGPAWRQPKYALMTVMPQASGRSVLVDEE